MHKIENMPLWPLTNGILKWQSFYKFSNRLFGLMLMLMLLFLLGVQSAVVVDLVIIEIKVKDGMIKLNPQASIILTLIFIAPCPASLSMMSSIIVLQGKA